MIIGLSGYAQTGKDAVAGILVERHGFTRIAFADALKQIAYRIEKDIARKVDVHGWEAAKQTPWVRAFLQELGVAVRDECGANTWVDAAMRKIDGNPGSYVISDVRFVNEAQSIAYRGGDMWRIERPGVSPVNKHVSETGLDGWRFDMWLYNGGTIDDLAAVVAQSLRAGERNQSAKWTHTDIDDRPAARS